MRGLVAIVLLLMLFACQGTNKRETIRIAAASSMQPYLDVLVDSFKQQIPSIHVEIIYASSGKLTAQIEQGAKIDLFFSANAKYPDYLYRQKLTSKRAQTFAQGNLLLWIRKGEAEDIGSTQGNIAIADPHLAPYGALSKQWLEEHMIISSDQYVLGNNIAQVNQYIYSGTVDFALTARSSFAKRSLPSGDTIHIESSGIPQQIQRLSERESVQKFYNFVFGELSQQLLQDYNYELKDK